MVHIKSKPLKARLADGEYVLAAEGYLFEFERRGYLKAGSYVPEVVLEHPHLVRHMYEEFAHAGSDVVEAFTYYGHRAKLLEIGRAAEVAELNRRALQIARQVADETGTLMAGNICNTTCFDSSDPKTHDVVREILKEQVTFAREEGADYIIAETFSTLGEAKLALEAIQQHGAGLPAVVTFGQHDMVRTGDGFTMAEACAYMEHHGAAVTGLNCSAGPQTIIGIMESIRKACKGPIACLPVPYRTTQEQPHFQTLKTPTGEPAFPANMDGFSCFQEDIIKFGNKCKDIGIQYLGLCCGNSSRYFRVLAETMGRKPAASRYSPDKGPHYLYGMDPSFRQVNTEEIRRAIMHPSAGAPAM